MTVTINKINRTLVLKIKLLKRIGGVIYDEYNANMWIGFAYFNNSK